MITFALLGAGRIGQMHAGYIARHPKAHLKYIFDINQNHARSCAQLYQCQQADSIETILSDDTVQVVFIATCADTHVDLIIQSATAGKAIFCEKPIDLDLARVKACSQEITGIQVPIQIGFNRRFDPHHSHLQQQVQAGVIGEIEQLVITSRDPGLPPIEYLKKSGGLMRDMAIHDFDMARFILGEEPDTVFAVGSTLVEPALKDIHDVDTAMITMTTEKGRQVQVNCSRRSVFGYDQRIEAFGHQGMLISENPRTSQVRYFGQKLTDALPPLQDFFIDRYQAAYSAQFESFINHLVNKVPLLPNFEDGLQAQKLAEAAQRSLDTGRPIAIKTLD